MGSCGTSDSDTSAELFREQSYSAHVALLETARVLEMFFGFQDLENECFKRKNLKILPASGHAKLLHSVNVYIPSKLLFSSRALPFCWGFPFFWELFRFSVIEFLFI